MIQGDKEEIERELGEALWVAVLLRQERPSPGIIMYILLPTPTLSVGVGWIFESVCLFFCLSVCLSAAYVKNERSQSVQPWYRE